MSEAKISFKKPKFRGGNRSRRERNSSGEEEEEEKGSSVIKIEKRTRGHLVSSSTGSEKRKKLKRVRKLPGKETSSSTSSSSSDEEEQERRTNVSVAFKGTGESLAQGNDATRSLETETSTDQDHRAIYERSRDINAGLKDDSSNPLEDNTYRGMNNYHKFIEKRDSAAGSAAKMSASGPKRAPTNIRSTVRWDYAPDICKDYKETGFCGFGDSCKFMHDRSDYKFGWQLERDMANGKYEEEDDKKYEISSDEDDLPFKCYYCKASFTLPVVTKCKHYFCEKCALAHYKKSQRCFACGKQTNGVFNPAKGLITKLDALKDTPPSDEDDEVFNEEEEEKKVDKYRSDEDESSEEEPNIPGNRNNGVENEDIDDEAQPQALEYAPIEIQNEVDEDEATSSN
ncbi:E3 ubiquitin-protein ligase RNF113A [Lepeophtheirus salmonis]|uniref:E3 ubiquitin-protein ligase RNF113A n=1 Tax=Lepeophtheirus salmonis TaxID=72036 RepID=UPI001AE9B4FC|nr:E3 ubiquitin-protein ligase RNF113A-like [Lepeophtheirus salmonis]